MIPDKVFRLRNARKLKGMSLREAAKGLGMSYEGLRKYENGKIKIDSTRLIKFANFYGVKVDYLIPRTRPEIKFGKIHYCKLRKYI